MDINKSAKIQVTLNERRFGKLRKYMINEQMDNLSQCSAELIEFALDIKARASEDVSRTNRELLESILEKVYLNEDMIIQTFIHANRYPEAISSEKIEVVRSQKFKVSEKSASRFKAYMSFEDEQ